MVSNMDCLIKILSHLSVRDRHNCRQVNSVWKSSSDHLFVSQKRLTIISRYRSHRLKCDNSCDTIVWPTNYIKYDIYCELISCFPNLQTFAFIGFDHWNDPLINHLIASCPALTSLEFIDCEGLGRNRNDDFFYINVTDNGWQRLISTYGQQLTKLVLQDCDLDDKQLDIIVRGFRKLVFLDISGNHIKNSKPLERISDTIEVMKLGPRLINGNHLSIDLPLNSLVAGNGRNLRELHIQFFLTRELNTISHFKHLNRLVIKYIKPLFREQDFEFFTTIATMKSLECLEIYEYNSHDGVMSLTTNQLSVLIRGCHALKKLVICCDVWCDSIICNSIIRQIVQYNKQLNSLSLCPGNFECTDIALKSLSELPLQRVSFTAFPAFTEIGFIYLIKECQTLRHCFIEECFEITQHFVDSLITLFKENPNRCLSLQISESKISAKIPIQLPMNLKISINKSEAQLKTQSNSSNDRLLMQTLISIITFISGLTAIIFTIIIYFMHLLVSKLFSKFSIILFSSLLTTISVIPVYFGLKVANVYVIDYLSLNNSTVL